VACRTRQLEVEDALTKQHFRIIAVAALLGGAGLSPNAYAGGTSGGTAGLACVVQGSASNTCVVKANTATINQVDAGAGELVYVTNNAVGGLPLANVTQLGFAYTSPVGGVSPRINIPVQGSAAYVFIEGATCNDGAGHVSVLTNPVCSVQYNGAVYPNWATFLSTNGNVLVVPSSDNQPYIIVDVPGRATISNVQLGKPLSGKQK
jgi:hypothetical protein